MSSAGHAMDAISRIKQNRQSGQERCSRAARLRQLYVGGYHDERLNLLSSLTPEEMTEVKLRIQQTARRERRRALFISCVVALIVIALFAAILFYIANY